MSVVDQSKPKSISIDGEEYVLKTSLPTTDVAEVVKTPVIGFVNIKEEVKTIKHRIEIFMTGAVFDFVFQLPKSTFRASNGLSIYCGDAYASQFHLNCLYMAPSQFRERRVNLVNLLGQHSGISAKADELKVALTELVVEFNKNSNPYPLKDMESL